jgi:CRP-like cAMP-binding protein
MTYSPTRSDNAMRRILSVMQPMAKSLNMPPDWIQLLAECVQLRRWTTGEILQIEGDAPRAMYIILSGRMKIIRISAQGREQVLHVAGPGDHVNMVPLIDEGPCPATVQTLSEVEALVCTLDAFQNLLKQEPKLAQVMMKDLARRQRQLVRLVDDLALHTVQSRVARLLLERAEALEHGESVTPLTQNEMASRVGTVREMIARTLKTFADLGIIEVDAGRITILDRAQLVTRSEE